VSQVTKNQHIVPELHLKQFSIPKNTQQRLECFNVDALRIEKQQSPSSICSGQFHYAIEPGFFDEYSQIVESAFGDIEDWYAKNIKRMESILLNKESLNTNDKYGLSWIIMNFYFRGHWFRKEINQSLDEVLEWMRPDIEKKVNQKVQAELGINEKTFDITSKTVTDHFKKISKNTSYATNQSFDEGHANTLTHKRWKILINNSDSYSFITGDEPVIELDNSNYPKNYVPARSFALRTQIFSLSPRVAIVASWPENDAEHGQFLFNNITNNKAEIFKQNLNYINHTHKYTYAPETTFFSELIEYEKRGTIPKLL